MFGLLILVQFLIDIQWVFCSEAFLNRVLTYERDISELKEESQEARKNYLLKDNNYLINLSLLFEFVVLTIWVIIAVFNPQSGALLFVICMFLFGGIQILYSRIKNPEIGDKGYNLLARLDSFVKILILISIVLGWGHIYNFMFNL